LSQSIFRILQFSLYKDFLKIKDLHQQIEMALSKILKTQTRRRAQNSIKPNLERSQILQQLSLKEDMLNKYLLKIKDLHKQIEGELCIQNLEPRLNLTNQRCNINERNVANANMGFFSFPNAA
jgi:hypothetical protein